MTTTFAGVSAWIIGVGGLQVQNALFRVPLPSRQIAALCIAGSVILFAGRGGTHIVRGILDKVGTLPTTQASGEEGEVDTTEYNRGRVIGNLERVLLVVMVALGAYETLGLIVAAKGLIRIKEFENRDFAEYFLIGTLTSVTVAFGLGWLLRTAVLRLW